MNCKLRRRLSLVAIAFFLSACGGGGSSSNGAGVSGGNAPAGGTASALGAGESMPPQEIITTASGNQVIGVAGLEGFEVPHQVTVLETR